jgi:HlyD family secretion protein
MAISSTTNIPGSSLMTIANPESIHTEINVDEADIAHIRIGQSAEVFAIAYPELALQGTVKAIASTAKVAYGRHGLSFEVEIEFSNNDELGIKLEELKPGMSARAEIFTSDHSNPLAVPVKAIQSRLKSDNETKEHHIYILLGERAKKVIVSTGISDDHFIRYFT